MLLGQSVEAHARIGSSENVAFRKPVPLKVKPTVALHIEYVNSPVERANSLIRRLRLQRYPKSLTVC